MWFQYIYPLSPWNNSLEEFFSSSCYSASWCLVPVRTDFRGIESTLLPTADGRVRCSVSWNPMKFSVAPLVIKTKCLHGVRLRSYTQK